MGLDAVVYMRRTRRVTSEAHEDGEAHTPNLQPPEVTAIHKRLGNASMIASLADEIRAFNENDSVLLSKVLYSGSHSGDEIGIRDIDKLDLEIRVTREKSGGTLSLAVDRFLKDMSDLVSKAKQEESPIVFI